jgi:hypothetical protein
LKNDKKLEAFTAGNILINFSTGKKMTESTAANGNLNKGQGCQIFLVQNTKTGKILPNYHKIYQMAIKYFQWL